MLNKKFVGLICLALVIGFLTGLVSFYNEFNVFQSYPFEVDVVYAYFKVFNVSSGVAGLQLDSVYGPFNRPLVAYVIVLNLTNPTDKAVRIRHLKIAIGETGTEIGQGGVSLTNTVISYERDFSDWFYDYWWQPNSSKLIAVSAIGQPPFNELGIPVLNQQKGYFYVALDCVTENKAYAKGFMLKQVNLNMTSENEFFYNVAFKENENFYFSNDAITIGVS